MDGVVLVVVVLVRVVELVVITVVFETDEEDLAKEEEVGVYNIRICIAYFLGSNVENPEGNLERCRLIRWFYLMVGLMEISRFLKLFCVSNFFRLFSLKN